MEIEKEIQSIYWRAVLKTAEYNFIKNFLWEPKGVDVCSEIVFSGHARAGLDGDDARVNS